MGRIWLIILVGLLILSPVSALEVGIEEADDDYILVLMSDQPIVISSFVIQLNYDTEVDVLNVESVEPYLTVANINKEESFIRIAASSAQSHIPVRRVPLARIIASHGFAPEILVEEIYDDDLNLIMGVDSLSDKESNYPEYQSPTYQPPVDTSVQIPTEIRKSWVLPIENDIVSEPKQIPIMVPKSDEEIPYPTGESEDTMSLENDEEDSIDIESVSVVSDPVAEKAPLKLITVIGTVLIVIFIFRIKS